MYMEDEARAYMCSARNRRLSFIFHHTFPCAGCERARRSPSPCPSPRFSTVTDSDMSFRHVTECPSLKVSH